MDGGRLEMEDIEMRFGGVTALRGVSLTLDRGEILGVIGPNGSGKSTLLNILAGAHRPTAGSVRLGRQVITRLPPARIAKLGIGRTFQNIRVFREFTVRENVAVSASVRYRGRRARRRTELALAQLGLQSWADRLAGGLPYGIQRRVEIARAMALDPAVLLLDEPAAGLNETESDGLLRIIEGLHDQTGAGILLIDHDMRLIMRACARIAVLQHGMKIAEGTPAEIRANAEVIRTYLG